MKRSEMVELLAKEILNNQGGKTAKEFADLYLKTLEQAGMLPPTRQALNWAELEIYAPNDSERPRFNINKWEPEE